MYPFLHKDQIVLLGVSYSKGVWPGYQTQPWHCVSDSDSLQLSLRWWVSNIESLTATKIDQTILEFTNILELQADNTGDLLGLTVDMKLHDIDVDAMQRVISCLQWRVTRRVTSTPKNTPPSPATTLMSATSTAARPNAETCPELRIMSALPLDYTVVPHTTLINQRISDVCTGSTSPKTPSWTWLQPRPDLVAQGSTTTHTGTAGSAGSFVILTPADLVLPPSNPISGRMLHMVLPQFH